MNYGAAKTKILGGLSAASLLALSLTGCTTHPPVAPAGNQSSPIVDLGRMQTLSKDEVAAHLNVPTEAQAAAHFGVPLAEHDIQPVWFRIENASELDYWILPVAIDPDYYTAAEAALITTGKRSAESAERVAENFRQSALPFFLPAGSINEGYVYASHARSGRFVDAWFSAPGHGIKMRFAVLLPTHGFDYEQSPLRELYSKIDRLPDLTLDQARERIRDQSCCTTHANGEGQGDPINMVLVGEAKDMISALTSSGWTFTEAISADSIRRMVGAAIAEKSMLTAPVSALYFLGRKQDVALQRGRSHIAQRNHMRLWLAPFRCEGLPVWFGQVSRDIGVKITGKSPTLTTHIIDPNVDEAREYVLHGLLHGESVRWFAFVRGVGAATPDQPRHNLTDDPYFTDGMRMVIGVSRESVPPWNAVNLQWNESTDPIREAKGEDAVVHQQRP